MLFGSIGLYKQAYGSSWEISIELASDSLSRNMIRVCGEVSRACRIKSIISPADPLPKSKSKTAMDVVIRAFASAHEPAWITLHPAVLR
jgi:hypothetical protein